MIFSITIVAAVVAILTIRLQQRREVNIVRAALTLIFLFASNAMGACPPTGTYAGCPFNESQFRTHNPQYSIERFPQKNSESLLAWFNHQPAGCINHANQALAIYSRYADGFVYYLHDGILIRNVRMDRVLLRDLIDGRVGYGKKSYQACAPRAAYLPTPQEYGMPTFTPSK